MAIFQKKKLPMKNRRHGILLAGLLSLAAAAACPAQSVPWESPLMICTGNSPTGFGAPAIFQDSSGVASVIRWGSATSDTLIAAFQWFPAPMYSPNWDKVAVKFSYDGGSNWTSPVTCVFTGLPAGNQRPFDPVLLQLPNGQIRMYFSDGVNNPPAAGIDTYSAVSADGIHYTVDSGIRFNSTSVNAIDPAVAEFNGTYYYNSWTGNMSDGANRATSTDGLNFSTQAMFPYDGTHLWLGNYMNDGSTLRYYGCGSNGLWMNSSSDGSNWSGYSMMPGLMGADPTVTKNQSGTYILIYTGPPNSTGLETPGDNTGIRLFPNPAGQTVSFRSTQFTRAEFLNSAGQTVKTVSLLGENTSTDISALPPGVYYIRFTGENGSAVRKFVKR